MGIPLGWNIVRDEAKEKDVLRADVTGLRSPIRRRARGSRPARRLAASDADALVDGHTSRFAAVLEHAPRLSHARTQLPPAPPVPDLRDRHLDREEPGAGHAHGPQHRDRPLPALTPGFAPARPRLPSARASPGARNGRRPAEALRDWFSRPEPDAAEDAAPAPPPARRHAPYPRPARRGDRSPYADAAAAADDDDDDDDDDESPRSPDAVSHPPLRRVGHRRIADGPLPSSSLRESWSPLSAIDGLGDRERSNSLSSAASDLPWHTFRTTVVPDPVAPTAESSFASSAASASFAASSSRASSSNSNSAASDRTHLTVPSRRPSAGAARRRGEEMSESFARACESSDEGDSTASDTEDEATANPLSRRRLRPSYFADEPPSPRRYGRSVVDRGVDARRYVRSYYSDAVSYGILYELEGPRDAQIDGPLDGPTTDEREQEADSFATVDEDVAPSTSPASPLDQELRDARSLLERLTQRGDIGDDFWASVGLTRSFADGVERVQERGRF